MYSLNTCVYTADRNWILLTDLASANCPPPLMVWRHCKFTQTRKPYTIRTYDKNKHTLILDTVYDISLVLGKFQRILTPNGLIRVRDLTKADEIFLYIDGECRVTRPRNIRYYAIENGMVDIILDNDNVIVARDLNSRWNAAFNIGILSGDFKGQAIHAQHMLTPRTLFKR